MRPLVRKTCDHVARIPMAGRVGSLNVSAAAPPSPPPAQAGGTYQQPQDGQAATPAPNVHRAANAYRPRDSSAGVKVPPGMTYRQYGAHLAREELRTMIGGKADDLCDAEVMDSAFYTAWGTQDFDEIADASFFKPFASQPDSASATSVTFPIV